MKIVVIDDDPTGSQTVHGCLLLLRWDVDVLRHGLRHPSPLLFVLANTRALPTTAAAERNREIAAALDEALLAECLTRRDVLLVSRGDSTLRGHGVLEPDTLQQAFGPFDATFHVPAFLEGGRTTVNGVHLLNGEPVHKSSFARDRLFGYRTSDLAAWLEEKSHGRIVAETVARLSLAALESDRDLLKEWLFSLQGNQPVVVDATRPEHLEALGWAIVQLHGSKRFLFRSAASLLNGLANAAPASLGPQLLSPRELADGRRCDAIGRPMPGLVMVGSHVPLADQQLECLLKEPRCRGIELPVHLVYRVLEGGSPDLLLDDLEQQWQQQIRTSISAKLTPVIYTSRGELCFGSDSASQLRRMHFGMDLARLMARLVGSIALELGYVISKGGITTGVFLEEGLGVPLVHLQGQLMPGLSAVKARDLLVVTCPGNLGNSRTLIEAWKLVEN